MQNQKFKNDKFIIFIFIFLLLAGCSPKEEKRHYVELTVDSPLASQQPKSPHPFLDQMRQQPESQPGNLNMDPALLPESSRITMPLVWTTPDGWKEVLGEGIRLATFTSGTSDTEKIECSIVVLGGSAGGLEANVVRWLNQLELSLAEEAQLQTFLDGQKHVLTHSGLETIIIDFTQLQNVEDLRPSMMAAIFEMNQKTIFIKMTGVVPAVLANKEKFVSLIKSIAEQENE